MEEQITENDDQMQVITGHSPSSSPRPLEDSSVSTISSRLQEEYTELLKCTINSVTVKDPGFEVEVKDDLDFSPSSPRQNVANFDFNENKNGCGGSNTKAEFPEYVTSAVASMASKMDGWLGELKNNVLAELTGQFLVGLKAQQQLQDDEMKELRADKACMEKEINKLNENINRMEESICRKDTLIENLTESLATQKGKKEVANKFYSWKANHCDKNRAKFTDSLAEQHHCSKITHKVFKAWFGLIQTKWRSRVESSCQKQASGVCLQLTNDYESKVCSLNSTIRCLDTKVESLLAEREAYADQVKKAFMRGVCALNMEAMSAFNPEQQQQSESSFCGDTLQSMDVTSNNTNVHSNLDLLSHRFKDTQTSKSLPPEFTATFAAEHFHDSPVIKESNQPMSLPADHSNTMHKVRIKSGASTRTKQIPAGLKQRQVLAPPMASVVVEKHQPVNKQTVGKATAVRYPKPSAKESATAKSAKGMNSHKQSVKPSVTMIGQQHFKPLAGQMTNEELLKTQVVSIKVVD